MRTAQEGRVEFQCFDYSYFYNNQSDGVYWTLVLREKTGETTTSVLLERQAANQIHGLPPYGVLEFLPEASQK